MSIIEEIIKINIYFKIFIKINNC